MSQNTPRVVAPHAARDGRDDALRELLLAVRAFSDAMDRMFGGMKTDMEMNGTDVAALRLLVLREQHGEPVSPHDLAAHLRISTASTTKMLDRLAAAGHVERRAHPHDRRARIVVLTDRAREVFSRHFSERLRTIRDVAQRHDTDDLRTVAGFLVELSGAIDPR